jgi:hypothetical protein
MTDNQIFVDAQIKILSKEPGHYFKNANQGVRIITAMHATDRWLFQKRARRRNARNCELE